MGIPSIWHVRLLGLFKFRLVAFKIGRLSFELFWVLEFRERPLPVGAFEFRVSRVQGRCGVGFKAGAV